ncbi:hypothetical protein KJ853_01985 [Patescibacteria group bacterium]|nr:hypothetical protein [Patescibacteria group bacterium]
MEIPKQETKLDLAHLRQGFKEYKEAEIKNGNEFLVRGINPDDLGERDLEIFFKYLEGSLSKEEFEKYTKELFPANVTEFFRKMKNKEISLNEGKRLSEGAKINHSVEELQALIANKCCEPEWRIKWGETNGSKN